MPIHIDELDVSIAKPDPDGDLSQRLAALESQLELLQRSHRELASYCQELEQACRSAFAECPGVAPLPRLMRS